MAQRAESLPPATADGWLFRPSPKTASRVRLFCFPHAGAGAALFRTWPRDLPSSVDLCAVRLPGRESRMHETAYTRLSDLVPVLASALRPYLDMPFALFGHSVGALACFELARHLQRETGEGPSNLFVAARRAPHRPEPNPPIHQLSDPDFIEAVRRRYNGIPDVVLREPELLALMLPTLRADFSLLETYRYAGEDRLICPISCFGGLEDPQTSHDDLDAWRAHTSGAFTLRMLPGDHFFVQSGQPHLLQTLAHDLAAGTR